MTTLEFLNNDFYNIIDKYRNYKSINTGFSQLDLYLEGLTPGLYLLGAESSLGKTTFVLQFVDYMALSGHSILFFSLEMSRFELICRSLSRIAFTENKEKATQKHIQYNTDPETTAQALAYYKENIAPNIEIVEGDFKLTVNGENGIKEIINSYIKITGKTPFVVIDYLQVLQPNDPRNLTKEAIDKNLTELKRMSRDLFTPVFVISSLNRANYSRPIDYQAFKESGSIEYTADVLLGLQYSIVNELSQDKGSEQRNKATIKKEKNKKIRDIQLVCLKNRAGKQAFDIKYEYIPKYNYFIEQSTNCQDDDIFSSDDILPF
jgi:replicative DNA helicase